MSIKQKLIVILGPTASGKSDLAVSLAKKFSGEIISADSRQVYRGFDIGSGKITNKEMGGIQHHLLDVASPRRTFSVARYQQLALRAVREILRNKKIPVVAGGTALYIDALLYGYSLPAVPPNPELRKKLEQKTTDELFAELQKRDPNRAATIDRHNPRRLIRALEIVIDSGAPVATLTKTPRYDTLKLGIKISKEKLEENIKKRLAKRLRQGMIREVERLHEEGLSWQRLDDFGLEYRYVSRYLRGIITKEEMSSAIVKESMQYAKRQMQWWKRDREIHWIENKAEAELLLQSFLE